MKRWTADRMANMREGGRKATERRRLVKGVVGKVVESLEWDGDYWVLSIVDGPEIKFKRIQELDRNRTGDELP